MDKDLIRVLRVTDALDKVVEQAVDAVMIMTDDDDQQRCAFPVSEWVDTYIEVTLDSGCCEHVLDLADMPGYAAFITDSPGSRRQQNFIVGNGCEVPNEGQLKLNLESSVGEKFNKIQSVFQVAEITRPLMSVSRITDLGLKCLFDDKKAEAMNHKHEVLCTFERKGGLYVARMKLKAPEGCHRPA